MTDLRKAAEMALDALDAWLVADVTKLPIVIPQTENTVFALRQALAQPWDTSDMAHRSGGLSVEQEPVICDCGDHIIPNSGAICGICASIKPSKPWVSLTDDEVKSILDCGRGGLVDIKKTEQLLKEKNT